MISIALPKGRLGDKVYNILKSVGYGVDSYECNSRKLIFCDENRGISYFWVKPSDVAVYVQHGAADVGVVGKDIIEDSSPDIYELADLRMGKCEMCVAAKSSWHDDASRPLRVATKFVNVAKKYYAKVGRDIEVIKLNGSIELAPILGMSDVIVDIVETGTTLKENDLKIFAHIFPISARLVANKASYKFKNDEILTLTKKLTREVKVND